MASPSPPAVPPGGRTSFWGKSVQGKDIRGRVSWCADQVTYDRECEGHITVTLGWKNPFIGWPWMQVGTQEYGFKAMERHTFEPARSEVHVAPCEPEGLAAAHPGREEHPPEHRLAGVRGEGEEGTHLLR